MFSRSPLRATSVLLAGVLIAGGGALATAVPASAATEVVTVDFSESTGPVHGGAAGYLYGLSDPDVPTASVIAGAGVKHLTQMPEGGEQHPNGGALTVSDTFFRAGGEEIYINVQDQYPQWGYANAGVPSNTYPGQADYLEKVRHVVQKVVDAVEPEHYDRYVITPFNEPDWIWYGNWGNASIRAQFFADWDAAYRLIQEIMPGVRVAATGEAQWNQTRVRDFLTHAKASNTLPQIFTWHELDNNDLRDWPNHLAQYRQIEDDLGIEDLPINITEYGGRRDTGVPGRMIQWLSTFEGSKVDAQIAYWTYSGNLDDHVAQTNGGNGAWWLLKWYADLTGETVRLTPPAVHQPSTIQGIAALDEQKQAATVLVGGGAVDVDLAFTGLDAATFGTEVDVQVSRTTFTGQEGFAEQPPIILTQRVQLDANGGGTITIPNNYVMDAYQVVFTPAVGAAPEVNAPWNVRTEAESTTLAGGASITTHNADQQATSNGRDVRGFGNAAASSTWTVEVPADGTYLLGVHYGTQEKVAGDTLNNKAGRHALFVDGAFSTVVQYSSTLNYVYKGRVDVPVELTAGSHTFSLRSSQNGTTALPGSNIALDKFELTDASAPEAAEYRGTAARLSGDWEIERGAGEYGGSANLGADGTAAFYLGAAEDGYYDVTIDYRTPGPQELDVTVNERPIAGVASDGAGLWSTTATIHFAKGVQELAVSGAGVGVEGVSVVRNRAADSNVAVIEAESPTVQRSAGITVETPGAAYGSNVNGQFAGWIQAGRTLTIPRPAGTEAGQYNFLVNYANAQRRVGHPYNTDGITRTADITETGGSASVTGQFRHNYSFYSFWWQNVPIELVTNDGAIVVGNPAGDAPNIDAFQLAKLVTAIDTTSRNPVPSLDVSAEASTRCVAGKAVVTVKSTNDEDAPVSLVVNSTFGSKTFASVAAGKTVSNVFTTRSGSVPAAAATVQATASVGGEPVTVTIEAPYDARSCG
ncbi:MAG: hypothetical protein WBX17_09295 [Microbacterium sp.]